METQNDDVIRKAVRDRYAGIATSQEDGCGCSPSPCCGDEKSSTASDSPTAISARLGYSSEELQSVPEGSNLGLGCGNPQAIASLKPGETVLDLGSGAGFDCFLASRQVGNSGKIIGVDMTPEMIAKARANADKGRYGNVEFRLGEIENLPVADSTVDVIMSNCVVNLSTDKPRVFREAFRVLKPGGRLAIADIVATAQLPDVILSDLTLYCSCVSGASSIESLHAMLTEAGFDDIRISPKDTSREVIREWVPGRRIDEYIVSASITASKRRT